MDELLQVGGSYGLRPAGMEARHALRLEAGMMLNGSDMDETIAPYEVVYGWGTSVAKARIVPLPF